MAVLAVGTDDWATEQAAAALSRAGHEVLRCHEPGEPTFPCNALVAGRTCPLDAKPDVVLAMRARPDASATPGEFGAICALRSGTPLVVAGMTSMHPFAAWANRVVGTGGDAVSACEEAAGAVALEGSQ
ncbi:MAG: hypothetical protein QOF60_1464 [Actinomycetota bacterium]|nr:hypothetical protein [Actinomycetota bacterium]